MSTRPQGRPPATSHAAIEDAAFRLFGERGFEATTVDDIAAELGIGRRTLFRYFPSKNDIAWGRFDEQLARFADLLRATDPELPLPRAIRDGVVAFNAFPEQADTGLEHHRDRMRLLLRTPALVAHSELRYTAWRRVVSEHVAERLAVPATDLRAVVAGRVSLAVALSAYEVWIDDPTTPLPELLGRAFDGTVAVLGA